VWTTNILSNRLATYAPARPVERADPRVAPRVLIVADDTVSGRALARLLPRQKYHIMVEDSAVAVADILARPPALIVVLAGPVFDGARFCATLKHTPATWHIPLIEIAGDAHRFTCAGVGDVVLLPSSTPDELALSVRVLLRIHRHIGRPEYVDDAILALVRAVAAKDPYTEGHVHRLAEYAYAIGRRLALSDDGLRALRFGALLHDVGKIGVDERIIRKAGPLTADEYRIMQQHTIIGERIVQPLHCAAVVMPVVRHHHERWDGCGYPDGLAGDDIPLHARIVAIADAFDAMTTQRPYNQLLSFAAAAHVLSAGAGTIWDPDVVSVFLGWLQSAHADELARPVELLEQAAGA
jgi:putative two-component system response regulator